MNKVSLMQERNYTVTEVFPDLIDKGKTIPFVHTEHVKI